MTSNQRLGALWNPVDMTTLGQDSSGRDLKRRIFYLALSMMGALGCW
jgi:hypothetical protein